MDGAGGDPVPEDVDDVDDVEDDVEDLDDDAGAELCRQQARLERNRSMIAHGRRIGGTPGAVMAGAMIALRDIYESPKTDEIVAVAETPDEPGDVDRDGMAVSVGDVEVAAPALPVTAPVVIATRRARRRARRR